MHDRSRFSPSTSRLFVAILISLLSGAGASVPVLAAVWTSIGPGGGSIHALAVAPSDSRVVYAGSDAGVWKSTDGGSSWTATESLGSPSVQALAVDANDPRRLFAGTFGTGVWISRDGGVTWSAASDGLGDREIVSLALDPHDPDVLYAGSANRGIWKSTDGGASWRHPGRGLRAGSISSIALDPRHQQVIYAVANGGVLSGVVKSTDGGATWAAENAGLSGGTYDSLVYQLALDPATPRVVYANRFPDGIFRSADGALTWTKTNLNGSPLAVGAGVVYVGSGQKSVDGGATVTATATVGPDLGLLVVDPQNPQTVYAGTLTHGVSRSTDGAASFRPASRGLTATEIRDLAVDGQEPPTVYAGVTDLGLKKLRTGRTWSGTGLDPINGGLQIDPRSPQTLYASVFPGLAKSTDGGTTWTTIDIASCFAVLSIAIDPQNPRNVFTIGTTELARCDGPCFAFRSRDAGATWTCMSPLTGGSSIAVDPLHPQTVYAANNDRTPWRSDDSGEHWRRAGSGVPGRRFSLVATSAAQSGLVFGFASPGVYTSTDGGRTFGKAGQGLPTSQATNLIADPADPRLVYAGFGVAYGTGPQDVGVFWSADQGATWSRLGTGLPANLFSGQLALDPAHRMLYAGTQGAGVFQIPLPAPQ